MRTLSGWACDLCERFVLRQPMGDSFRESRMWEICSSGSTRGEGGHAILSYSTVKLFTFGSLSVFFVAMSFPLSESQQMRLRQWPLFFCISESCGSVW